jgi:hypothetical protein
MSHGYCGTCLRINLWIANKMDILSQYAGGTAPYQTQQAFTLRGDSVAQGDTVQLSTAQAATLIAAGFVKAPAPGAAQPVATPAQPVKK